MTGDEPEAEADATLSKAEARQRRVEQQRVDAAKVHAEIEAARTARESNTLRLRALRMAKEAAEAEAAATTSKRASRKPK